MNAATTKETRAWFPKSLGPVLLGSLMALLGWLASDYMTTRDWRNETQSRMNYNRRDIDKQSIILAEVSKELKDINAELKVQTALMGEMRTTVASGSRQREVLVDRINRVEQSLSQIKAQLSQLSSSLEEK